MKFAQDQIDQVLKGAGVNTGDTEVSFDEIESFGDDDSMKEMVGKIASYNSMLKEKITFINAAMTKAIPFTRENLYLMCAYSGSGKSSLVANVVWPLWKQKKKTLVMSNEESKQDILFRIACLDLGYDFNAYKKGNMPITRQKEVLALFPEIVPYVKVVDVEYKEGITTKAEGIKNLLTAVQNKDYSAALIDYWQLIKYGAKSGTPFEVLDDLRVWLMKYIKTSNIPIVITAQLHSIGKRANKDLDNRIKDAPTIYEAATVVFEMIPNFEDKTSDFILHKDRFGLAGLRIKLGFDRGRFVKCDQDFMDKIAEKKINKLTQDLENLSEDNKEEI